MHDWKTFYAFVAAGALQGIIAWYSGHLAVVALPGDKSTKAKNRGHKLAFAGLAILLLILTCVVGYLNDRSQYAADERAKSAEKAQTTISAKLGEALLGIGQEQSSLNALRADLAQGKLSTQQIVTRVDAVQKNLGKVVSAVAGRSSLDTPPTTQSPPSVEPKDIKLLTNAELKAKTRALAVTLRDLNTTYANKDKAIRTAYRAKSEKNGPQWGGQKDSTTQGGDNMQTWLEIPVANNIKELADTYRDKYMADAISLRDEMLNRMPVTQSRMVDRDSLRRTYSIAGSVDSRYTFVYDVRTVAGNLEMLTGGFSD